MSGRFFLDSSESRRTAETAVLGGAEAHHFLRVMRGKTGETIELFDGTGFLYRGTVIETGKNEVRIKIAETLADTIESPVRLTVASALPKGDRQRFLVEKLAELGVARFIPVHLERSVARADDAVINRFRRCVIESAKQCGRNVLMEIGSEMPLVKLNDLLDREHFAKLVLHPVKLGSVGQTGMSAFIDGGVPQHLAVLVGPEGSFTDKEIAAALQFGFRPLDLGARILRTETACIAAAAAVLTREN
ncbi:MAG: 16S rRNA (uracil(1498)-N(3))-methyltransferase [Planctomycetaceae bacterium]|jgi:16S rRNA (uracil1498-N3)-methyltransferase|nr:16S rRNA (uracil(1498)-N(3))-methyltransferase [Planctomycetaceae bacterium]